MNKTFIRCSDPESATKLKKLGFIVYSEENGVTTFINDVNKPQGFEQTKGLVYTNKIEI